MQNHTVIRTSTFFAIMLLAYIVITTVTVKLNTRTLSSFMFTTDSDMLWQILAVGAGIAIALQVNVSGQNPQGIEPIARGTQTTAVHPHMLTRHIPTLIAVGVTFPTFDYLSSFIMRPERQLVQWPAWEISSALCFTVAISAFCMNAQGMFPKTAAENGKNRLHANESPSGK